MAFPLESVSRSRDNFDAAAVPRSPRSTAMRRIIHAGFCIAFALVVTTHLSAQKQPQPVPVDPVPPNRADNGQFTLPEQRESRERLKAVMDYLERNNIPWPVVCSAVQDLLNAKSDSFYRVKDAKGNDTGAVVSVKTKVNQLLSTFAKEGRATYEQEYGPAAKELLRKAIAADFDKTALAIVSQQYFHTKAGGQATLLMASIHLETGFTTEAAFGFQRLLARPDAEDYTSPKVIVKAVTAYRRSGDSKLAEAADKLMEQLSANYPRDGIIIGADVFTLEKLRTELAADAKRQPAATVDASFANRLGNASRTGLTVGGTPFLDPVKDIPMIYRRTGNSKDGAEWIQQQLDFAYTQVDPSREQVVIPGSHPVTAGNLLIYRGYDGVYAVATQAGAVVNGKERSVGELVWFSPTAGGALKIAGDEDRETVRAWWENWKRSNPQVLLENASVGSLSHDGKTLFLVDDLGVLPPAPVNNGMPGFQPQPAVQPAANIAGVRGMVGYNRLTAIDLETGNRIWILGGPETAPLSEEEEEKSLDAKLLAEGAFYLGPPLAVNGKLYALMERKNQIRLVCYDLGRSDRKPELVWIQNLGETATTLRTDTPRRMQPAYLAYADGVMICPTNCGAAVAVDINSRRLLWARFYGSAPDPKSMPGSGVVIPGGGRFGRPGFDQNTGAAVIPTDRWRASAPMIAGNKVILTAYNSDLLQCLDLQTGEAVWQTPREKDDLYIGSVQDEKIIVVGKRSTRAYAVNGDGAGGKKIVWDKIRTGTPCGHGIAAKGGIFYLPMIGNPDEGPSRQPQIWAIDVQSGQVKSKTMFRKSSDPTAEPRRQLGNLVFQDGQLFSVSALSVKVFPLIELKRKQMTERLKENPNDPDGLTARGELLLDNGELFEAVADFHAARKFDPSPAVRANIDGKLYIAYTEILRNKFEDGQKYLDEYEKLCDIPTESDDPSEKAAMMDEKLRRRNLFLVITARGREKQGRLTEAFDAYRAFASLGDNRQLVSIPDEPNVLFRPDVWARSRIEAMMRNAKDSPGRKALDERILADWQAIRSSGDLVKTREFVRVFGVYFQAGREARFHLSELLLKTSNENDQREAQTLLMQLWAMAQEPAVEGRAIEMLARLMIRRGMMEDAVGLYAQLAARYADVIIRDGKTGAEIYGELITDKRLLPYLEPAGTTPPAKYKVEATTQPVTNVGARTFQIRPEGELFPYYRRFQFIMESAANGDGTWALRVIDPAGGDDRCKFTGLNAVPNVSYNSVQQSASSMRLAQASGHLLLVNLGHMTYCFDLAEKRELWRQSLLSRNGLSGNFQINAEADGEIVIRFDDNWQMRLGRSSVLVQSYAAMLTRDGLRVVDPTTGSDLWSHNNLAAKTPIQLFGDDQHLFIVEGQSTRVLRAADGLPVEGVKDFGSKFAGSVKPIILGRMLLTNALEEGERTFRLYDPLNAVELWSKKVSGKSVVLRTNDRSQAGFLKGDGSFEVFEGLTGKTIASGTVDADRLMPDVVAADGRITATLPLAVIDSERVYLVLNKPTTNQNIFYGGQSMMNSLKVNGAIYAFDRAGKRLWYNPVILANHQLILDRFEELPVLIAGNMTRDEPNSQWQYRIAVLDKRTGRLMHNYAYNMNGGEFSTVIFEPRSRRFEFQRAQDGLRLRIEPTE